MDIFAKDLCASLERKKISVFSSKFIRWGENIFSVTQAAIARCTHGLVIVSPGFLRAYHCQEKCAEHAVADVLTMKAGCPSSFTLLPLLVKGVKKEEMEKYGLLLSSYQSFQVGDEKDDGCVEKVATELEEVIAEGKCMTSCKMLEDHSGRTNQ